MTNPKAIQMQDYEPYIPEGLTLPKVGDKVEVHVSGECEFKCPNGCGWHWSGATDGVVVRVQTGQFECYATVKGKGCCESAPRCGTNFLSENHPYQVDLPCGVHGEWYAAIELTVVEADND